MGRKARFTQGDFIRAALELLSEQGLNGVTMAGIAERIGAPVGSVYHRFASREILLAELWVELIESFQSGFIKVLESGNGQKAALYTLKWIRKHPNQARVFLLYRREQLITGNWPEGVKDRVEKLMEDLNESLKVYTQQLFGKASQKNLARVAFCLIHVPTSAARDYLEAGKPIPGYFDQFVRETIHAVLEHHQAVGGSGK